jgi:hypothetical protein
VRRVIIPLAALALGGCGMSTAAHRPRADAHPTTSSAVLGSVGFHTLTLAGTSIRVPRTWLVIDSRVHNGVCRTPRDPGTVWLGHISGFDCPAGEPGAGPATATLVVFSTSLYVDRSNFAGHAVVNGMRVDRVNWHLGALYGREWPRLVHGYYSPAEHVGLAAVGPDGSRILGSFAPKSS